MYRQIEWNPSYCKEGCHVFEKINKAKILVKINIYMPLSSVNIALSHAAVVFNTFGSFHEMFTKGKL